MLEQADRGRKMSEQELGDTNETLAADRVTIVSRPITTSQPSIRPIILLTRPDEPRRYTNHLRNITHTQHACVLMPIALGTTAPETHTH